MSIGDSGIQGSILNLLAEWWGTDGSTDSFSPNFSLAANLYFGGNPLYQISDFLATYPKFGTQPQGLVTVQPNATNPGSGYSPGDLLAVVQNGGLQGVITVSTIGVGGVPTSYSVTNPGRGYQSGSVGLVAGGGSGSGATVDILAITPPNLNGIPAIVLQLYINLASSSLQQARWQDLWQLAMPLYVAHFATLYLRSEGNTGTTPGQIAASGLTRGIMVTKIAGNVSATVEVPRGLEDWGAWTQTEYGTQLATFAKIVGMGAMYVV